MIIKRDSNIELYRSITMLLIIAHHFVVNSGIMDSMWNHPASINSLFLFMFGAWGKIGINCFVLITGYFMCKTTFKSEKILKLFTQVLFYNIVIFVFFLCFRIEEISIKRITEVITPINNVEHNFTSCFLLFYLCIPFLNTLISNINERKHIFIIGLSLIIYTVCGMLFRTNMNYVSWFIVLYFIASYIRLYPKPIMNNCHFWGLSTFLSVILSILSVFIGIYISVKTNTRVQYYFISDTNAILALTTSICSFLFFKNLQIKQSKIINCIASTTFGILLIHANCDTMRQWLWHDFLQVSQMIESTYLIPFAVISVVIIFFVCATIDFCRNILFERIGINDRIENCKLTKRINRFFND